MKIIFRFYLENIFTKHYSNPFKPPYAKIQKIHKATRGSVVCYLPDIWKLTPLSL
jgi:hypothetical protein